MTIDLRIVRLNLGCGDQLLPSKEGWINVDINPPSQVVLDSVSEISSFPFDVREVNTKTEFLFLKADIRDLSKIASESVHEIHAYHLMSCFHYDEVPVVLAEIKRLLKPDVGCFVCEQPDILKCAKNFLQVETTKNPELWHSQGLQGIYGISSMKNPYLQNKWGWYPESLGEMIARAGFKHCIQQPSLVHNKDSRDFRLVSFMDKIPNNFEKKTLERVQTQNINAKQLTGIGIINRNTGKAEPLVVQPRDSVADNELIGHTQANIKLIDRWLQRTKIHSGKAFIVSAGPSLKKNIEKLKKEFNKGRGDMIFCVKHSLPVLVEAGITPDFCVVLDPRPLDGVSTHGKVRKELFTHIPKETKFLVASMTNREVTEYLKSRGADIIGWHAYAAGINNFLHLGIKLLITGGTSACMRTVNIAYSLGFREIVLVSVDSCQAKGWIPSEEDAKNVDQDGRKKFVEIYYKNPEEKYWSTGELVAQMQDIIAVLQSPNDIIFDVWAEGIIEAVWNEYKHQFEIADFNGQGFIENRKML